MEKDCQRALDQIDEKMYAKEFEDSYDQVNCYGIAFLRKGVWWGENREYTGIKRVIGIGKSKWGIFIWKDMITLNLYWRI